MFAHPGSQSFVAQTKCVGHTDSRPVRGFEIGLSTYDELDGTSLEVVGAFHWQVRISFYQSTCLDYPREVRIPDPTRRYCASANAGENTSPQRAANTAVTTALVGELMRL